MEKSRVERRGEIALIFVDDMPIAWVFSTEDGFEKIFSLYTGGVLDQSEFGDLEVRVRESGIPKFNRDALQENIIRCTVANRLLESQSEVRR